MKKHRVRDYKDKKRPHLKYVVNVKEEGKRARQFFETKVEAKTFAELKDVQLLNGGKEAANFPSALRVMAGEASAILAPFNRTIMDAVNFYLPHLHARNRTCTFQALTDELLDVKRRDGASARYLGDLRSRLGQFAGTMNDRNVAEISETEVDEWLRSLDLAATTRNNFRRVLIVAFNFAIGRGYCVTNPATKSAKAKEVEGAVGILTVHQTARLVEVAPAELVPFITIGAFAGLRRAELERLDWSEVDLESGLIQITASKAKSARRRFVKIRSNLDSWLRPLARQKEAVTPSNYRELFDAARKSAGITEWPQNALRHGFASYDLAHENDAARLALELGHTNAHLVFQHYRQVVKPKEAARYWNIKPAPSSSRKKIVPFAVRA